MDSRHVDHPVYIQSNEDLLRFCRQWMNCEILALDTEFIRTDTFYPKGALIQVSDGTGCFLIDPLPIDDFSPFKDLLENEQIVKILHSCSEDLEVFDTLFGIVPHPIFDTQIAASMVGYGYSLGYQAMTEKLLSIHVPKGETRSNWLQRPLTTSQIHYAALDVAYLPEMYLMLMGLLQEKGRLQWMQEECSLLVKSIPDEEKINSHYIKVKSAWKLTGQQLTLLQRLVQWREIEARHKNIPRGRVVKDRCCFDIAQLQPQSLPELGRISELPQKLIRQDGEMIIDLVKDVKNTSETEYLEPLQRPLPPETGSILKRLQSHI
ncbi:MAG: ribonuclease D, partial [Gammaproteobacteria bacterium]